MRKILTAWRSIPRKIRAMVNIGAVLLLAFLFYMSIGSPAFTTEQAFRRAEKIHMVGPSTIVDTLDWDDFAMFETLIVGETDYGVIFYGEYRIYASDVWPQWPQTEVRKPVFSYREKTGDLTVLAPPVAAFGLSGFDYGTQLPVYLFDAYPDAVRAELEMTVTGTVSAYINGELVDTEFSHTFSEEATRLHPGYFRFDLRASGEVLDYISHISNGSSLYRSLTDSEKYARIPVTVRLYDENDRLIMETERFIQTPAAQAHEDQGQPLT